MLPGSAYSPLQTICCRPISSAGASTNPVWIMFALFAFVQDGRIFIERVNEPFLAAGGSGDQFRAGIARAIVLGWLWRHESGTYMKFTDSGAAFSGAALFAGDGRRRSVWALRTASARISISHFGSCSLPSEEPLAQAG